MNGGKNRMFDDDGPFGIDLDEELEELEDVGIDW